MKYGLLWYDGDPKRPLEDKITRAARCYRDKYGRAPNTCYVHAEADEGKTEAQSRQAFKLTDPATVIHVVSAPNVLLNHFWVGECSKNGRPKKGPGA